MPCHAKPAWATPRRPAHGHQGRGDDKVPHPSLMRLTTRHGNRGRREVQRGGRSVGSAEVPRLRPRLSAGTRARACRPGQQHAGRRVGLQRLSGVPGGSRHSGRRILVNRRGHFGRRMSAAASASAVRPRTVRTASARSARGRAHAATPVRPVGCARGPARRAGRSRRSRSGRPAGRLVRIPGSAGAPPRARSPEPRRRRRTRATSSWSRPGGAERGRRSARQQDRTRSPQLPAELPADAGASEVRRRSTA